ncbi:MAG: diguanylate cyclase [Nitrospiraceae bacterium]|nr:diguanylate cyclase [Nitrospiraceae bacterium]
MAKAKILLVEDSNTQGAFVKDYLEKTGYEVLWVQNGKSALKAVTTEKIDIVLLDVILPDISGNEVCRWMKSNEKSCSIPIIMLTVKGAVTDKIAGFQAGADDYLPKPYSEIELNARIYTCLRTKTLQDELRKKNVELEDKNFQLEAVNNKLNLLSTTDMLTGAYNRRKFEEVLKLEFAKVQRYNKPLACMMLDIDHFKKINDTFGHHSGDAVLKETYEIIKSSAREIDTVARWGGEEFIMLLPDTKKEDAMSPANRILKGMSSHLFPDIPHEHVTISIGVAGIPDPNIKMTDEEKIVLAADFAMYAAKKKGRNRIEMA